MFTFSKANLNYANALTYFNSGIYYLVMCNSKLDSEMFSGFQKWRRRAAANTTGKHLILPLEKACRFFQSVASQSKRNASVSCFQMENCLYSFKQKQKTVVKNIKCQNVQNRDDINNSKSVSEYLDNNNNLEYSSLLRLELCILFWCSELLLLFKLFV